MIQILNKNDCADLKKLFDIFYSFKNQINKIFLDLDKEQIFILFKEYLIKENVVCYYYVIEDKIAGFIIWEIKKKEPIISNAYFFWNIRYLYVEPCYRWDWISTKLKEEYFIYLRDNNIFKSRLTVSKDNILAQNIYHKRWFNDLSVNLEIEI